MPTIMIVANDLKLLKLLDMALKLELACDIFSLAAGKSAEETAKRIKPDLLILDEQLLDCNAYELADRLHSNPGLEQVPLLLINVMVVMRSKSRDYPTVFLKISWKMEGLYSAVYELLGQNPGVSL